MIILICYVVGLVGVGRFPAVFICEVVVVVLLVFVVGGFDAVVIVQALPQELK